MFEDIGEYTLCEFEVIERPSKDINIGYNSVRSSSEEPVLLHIRDACSPPPLSPIAASSPCSSSPYSFLSPQTSHTFSPCPSSPRRGPLLTASDFRPIRKLGKGGQGTVYLVEDTVSERYLAMKVIEKNGLRLREYPAVFEEQAVTRTLAADAYEDGCSSPLSVPLAGSFEDTDNFYFLTDYYPGGDLMKWMKRYGTVPAPQARLWCAELLVALQSLHKRRIIHRDVKPDNILIDEDNHIALTDFGIARAFGSDQAERPWTRLPPWNARRDSEDSERRGSWMKGRDEDETHTLAGTAGYVAPEVYSGKYSYGVDVWGAGVVLYSMLVGRLPFGLQPKDQRLEELITRTDTIPADFDLYGVVDGEIRDLLTKMLEKDPKKRPSIRKLKKHRWFHGMDWDAIERRERRQEVLLDHARENEESIDVSYGRPYGAFDQPPHEWFEWVSPNLRGIEGSFETTNEWSLGSTCYTDCDLTQSEDDFTSVLQSPGAGGDSRKSRVMQKMKGWVKRRMSISKSLS